MNAFDLLKKLREESGVGMLDCKRALDESGNDYKIALEYLRKKGIASAQKKMDRIAKEGLVSYKSNGKFLAICEINCETDFVSRSDKFQEILNFCLDAIINNDVGDVESLKKFSINDESFEDLFRAKTVAVGENVQISRIEKIDISNSTFSVYMHNAVENNSNAGRILSVIFLDSKIKEVPDVLSDLKKISMHIAATKPISLNESSVNSAILEKEREIFLEQAKASGKPENVIQKMTDGRIRKFLQENVLLLQQFVINPDITVQDFFLKIKKDYQFDSEIKSFIRWQLGEQ